MAWMSSANPTKHESMNKIEQIKIQRQHAHSQLLGLKSKVYKAFLAMESAAYRDGALPKKTKELIAVGISVVIHCESCMEWHITQAASVGAVWAERAERISMTILKRAFWLAPLLMTASLATAAPDDPVGLQDQGAAVAISNGLISITLNKDTATIHRMTLGNSPDLFDHVRCIEAGDRRPRNSKANSSRGGEPRWN